MPARETLRTLRELQTVIRAPDDPDARHGRSGRVPEDLVSDELKTFFLTEVETDAFDRVVDALGADLAFEYLDRREAETLAWRLACQADIDRHSDHVASFVNAHERTVERHDVYFTLRHLEVKEEFTLGGATYLPVSSTVPAREDLTTEPDVQGIIYATASGTSGRNIADRARRAAEHSLRLLRNGLRTTATGAHNRQLRFELGERYAFTGSPRAGWQLDDRAAWGLAIDEAMAERVAAMTSAVLKADAANSLESHAAVALEWADRSLMTSEPLIRILYLFFALEALVGDRSAGEKGRRISFRRAMLDHATRGGFRNPHLTYAFYDEVRSAAVHGGRAPEVTTRDADELDWDIRAAIDQLIEFASSIDARKHSTAMQGLDTHEDADELVAWLRDTDQDRTGWHTFTPVPVGHEAGTTSS